MKKPPFSGACANCILPDATVLAEDFMLNFTHTLSRRPIFLFFSMANISPVGGLVGAIGAVVSARVFRSNYSTAKKFGFIALIFVGAFFALVVIKVLFQLLTGRPLQ